MEVLLDWMMSNSFGAYGADPLVCGEPLARLLRIREPLRNRVGSWVGGN